MREIIAYQCDYCEKKITKSKSGMYKHESKCYANPINKACRTCKNFERYEETVYNRNHGGNPGSTDYEIEKTCCNRYNEEFNEDFKMQFYCVGWEEAKERNW